MPVQQRQIVDASGNAVTGLGVAQGAFTDRSGTCNGANQTLMAANLARRFLLIQNKSNATGPFWINFDGTDAVADSPSIEVVAGVTLIWEGTFVPTGQVEYIGASGIKATAKEG